MSVAWYRARADPPHLVLDPDVAAGTTEFLDAVAALPAVALGLVPLRDHLVPPIVGVRASMPDHDPRHVADRRHG